MSAPINVNSEANDLIKEELSKFILTHTGQDALSSIDEIVLSYMVGILESLSNVDSPEDEFDVDEFSEMMSAYIPAFTDINSSHICEWMFNLVEWLKKTRDKNGGQKSSLEETFSYLTRIISVSVSSESSTLSSSPCSSSSLNSQIHSTCQSDDDERSYQLLNETIPSISRELELLAEMFPHMNIMDLQQCISVVSGDCQKAVQLILQKQENGQQNINSWMPSNIGKYGTKDNNEFSLGDKKLREHILNKYGYIDQDDDAREHKPVPPKSEPKKLIRYRDNKIVSIKGERFSEVKTNEDEAQKKTIISLKPSRQYRFH